jgi:peroxiredoxin
LASVEVNKKAPDFETKDYLGNEIKLSNFEGKNNVLIVLNRGFV